MGGFLLESNVGLVVLFKRCGVFSAPQSIILLFPFDSFLSLLFRFFLSIISCFSFYLFPSQRVSFVFVY